MGVLQCFSNYMPVTSPLSEEASHWPGLLPCWWQWGIFSTPVLLSWSKADSETIGDSETAIQKLRFRNYCHPFRNYCDSETNAIQKLRFRNYCDSETIAIQKLSRFRNYQDSETIAIQKLSRFRNYRDSETIAIQKLRFRNYRDSETIPIQKLSRFRNYDSATIAIQKLSQFRNYHPHGTSHWFGMSTRIRWYPNSRPHGTSHWLGLSTRIRWYPNSHPHGPSNWLGLFPQGSDEIKIPTPMELHIDLGCPQGSDDISKFPPPWNFKLTWTFP